MSKPTSAFMGVSYDDCFDCHGTGTDPHGNTCIFCDGFGSVEEKDEADRLWFDESDDEEDEWDDGLCTPVQKP